ncbi:GNAT family N-acetyltransferase [Fontisubflavum oceani]|uniref:GNAT family N-acetyltransferase n=1 Tax=Fontisubflavum oceani TaxID=2978973 RepID=UPI0025B4553A|nr:GNAT family N-acetyltransferase [Fontisubflavum oceani]WJY20800.1 GNAT family N-acetyltransferase [Fontisubflavum oceani]
MPVSMVETNPADFDDWPDLFTLLAACFGPMEGQITPPSSFTRMTPESLRAMAAQRDIFLIRAPKPIVCLFGQTQGSAYYLSKLATAHEHRGQGLARALIEAASTRAKSLDCTALTLQTRVELIENHTTFRALGFTQTGQTCHPGFDRPTSLTFRRAL